jgi:prolyl oligopeptidase
MPESISATIQAELQKQAEQAIANVVIPAYRRFQVFFYQQYLTKCRESVGAYALPNGKAFYTYRAHRFTTTELAPEEIHQIGLKEVARIRNEMEDLIKQLGFGGSFNEFLRFLRTDPQFYYQDPDALLQGYRAIAKKIDPELVKLFGRLPRMPYGVKPIPVSSAPDTATGYYQPPAADGSRAGYYYVNLYKPEVRPKYEMEVLTLHEAVPGHHLQIALQQELRDLPNFRRFSGFTAFEEGWGLYAESLGEELGLYQNLYSKFGQLTYEMWRAIRLVVDTGIHFKGWTRQQAIDFFKENAAKTEHDIVNEIDRYIAWPGQALAYKIGELKIKALRQRASVNLGDNFNIRAFHDVLLSNGALPLDILERNINKWIRTQQETRGVPETSS